jgi:hypothetical protein
MCTCRSSSYCCVCITVINCIGAATVAGTAAANVVVPPKTADVKIVLGLQMQPQNAMLMMSAI